MVRPRGRDRCAPSVLAFPASPLQLDRQETKESPMRGVIKGTRPPCVTGGKGLPSGISRFACARRSSIAAVSSPTARRCALGLLVIATWLCGCAAPISWFTHTEPVPASSGMTVRGQTPTEEPQLLPLPSADPEFSDPLQAALDRREKTRQIVRIEVEGNRTIPRDAILEKIKTRPGRPVSDKEIKEDLRRLYATRWFFSVEPVFRHVDGGDVLVFRVLERPVVRHVEFRGNELIKTKHLQALTGLEPGSPYDVSINREAARRIVEYYREKGFADAKVRLIKGDSPQDRDVIFEIEEGTKLIVSKVSFSGNEHISSAILKTKLQTKRALLGLPILGGVFKPDTIKDDIAALTRYYNNLGYFDVRIDYEVSKSRSNWNPLKKGVSDVHIHYVIDEGPRYVVRRIEFEGNQVFSVGQLTDGMKLKEGEYFNARLLNMDVDRMRRMYGETGRLFATIDAVPRFLEQPGQVDVIFKIDEDEVHTIRRINVHILGDNPHTRETVVLNRILISPGDLADPELIRRSERRLEGQIFDRGARGPRIEVKRVEPTEAPVPLVRGQTGGIERLVTVRATPIPATSPERHGGRMTSSSLPAGRIAGPAETVDARLVAVRHRRRRRTSATFHPPDDGTIRSRPLVRSGDDASKTTAKRRVPPRVVGPTFPRPAFPPEPFPPFVSLTTPSLVMAPDRLASAATVPPASASGNIGTARNGDAGALPVIRGQNEPTPVPTAPNPIYEANPYGDPFGRALGQPPGTTVEPRGEVDLDVYVTETQTGRLMFGVGVNSNAGVIGSIVLEENNFDITRFPRSWDDIINGRAWRGAGQRFRLEAVPGNIVSRYLVAWSDPYFLDTDFSLGVSGFYFNRFYPDWDEDRLGGRISVGRQMTREWSLTAAFRLENVRLRNPDSPTPPIVLQAVGDNFLSSVRISAAHDTRDAPFLPAEGHFLQASYEQAFGDFQYPKFELEGRQYFTTYMRPDGGGRHIFSIRATAGWTGDDTPVFERFFAGGFQSFRGFAFRGVGPVQGAVRVGGQFLFLTGAEYMFPLTADEMISAVVFTDAGTIDSDIRLDAFRVSVGAGLRLTIPAMGPAPIALDWSIPIARESTDTTQVFSFYIGFTR
ncbi:MAG: hypothetical protein D6725_13820 [Planctomycetota bacterium]|nr:MAG: hypothetical protein D6725_13820 [Planctomycetota bacterium]